MGRKMNCVSLACAAFSSPKPSSHEGLKCGAGADATPAEMGSRQHHEWPG